MVYKNTDIQKRALGLFVLAVGVSFSERSIWSKKWIKRRQFKMAGSFQMLKEFMREDRTQFKNYVRVDVQTFKCLVKQLHPYISKKNTNYRKCISVAERLALTLRFLATGKLF